MPDFSVLFVDDEPITRRISSRLLSRRYVVLEAGDGQDALSILEDIGDRVGVVVTDMKMDRMDGLTLIDIISKRYPEIPVIASTGDLTNYDFDALIAGGKVFAAIEKPWNLSSAVALIGTAMASRQPT